MCIVVYKKEGIDMPSEDVLLNCFNNNPDGAGFMYSFKGKVYINKGFMTFEAFLKALKSSIKAVGDKIPYVLHFRISTQAGTRPDCTHPYPLSSNMENLRKLKFATNIGLAHNGIIDITSSFNKQLTYNDTMLFITDFLSLIIRNEFFYEDKKALKLIERLTESKLAILSANGHCALIGQGWIEDDGIIYSNYSYQMAALYFTEYDVWDEIEIYYNEETGLYDFDDLSCPNIVYGTEEYCPLCKNYPKCNSYLEHI